MDISVSPRIFITLPVVILILFVIIALIILFVKLCSKRPWIAAGIALVFISFVFTFIFISFSHRRVGRVATIVQKADSELSATQSEYETSAIWLPGVEDEFEADVYPSKLSAVRSLGMRIGEPVRQVFGSQTDPEAIILFKGAHDTELLEEFTKAAVARVFPDIKWTVAPETMAVQSNEVGIRLDIVKVQTHPRPWMKGPDSKMTSGTIQANVMAADKQASIKADFVDKPWIEDFMGFWNSQLYGQVFIANSADSCITQAEANRQALQNACVQLTELLNQIPRAQAAPTLYRRKVTSTDVLEGDFILDRFVQSFDGRAGRIWRQALLIDASAEKLKMLAQSKAVMARAKKMSLARIFFSIVGLLVLITVVYAFLNAATRGYYAWSLRIAGIVLALVVIILLLS